MEIKIKKIKLLKKIVFDYRTYLFIGIACIVLAPFAEFLHWGHRSISFAKWAFLLFCISVGMLAVSQFFENHPQIKKKVFSLRALRIKSLIKILWKK